MNSVAETVDPEACDGLSLTPAQIAELDRRLDDFERHPEAGESWPSLRERLRRDTDGVSR